MKKNSMIKLAASAATVLLMTTSAHAGYTMKKKVGDIDTKLTVFGFSQINAQSGTGKAGKDTDQNVKFGADRIRLGWKYSAGKVRGKVFLDFNQNSAVNDDGKIFGEDVGAARIIKDAFISYVEDPAFVVKAGIIKTPVGMGFTIPGWNLDVIKRGFDKQLAFERGNGLMISGRAIGGKGKVNGFEMGHERPMTGFGYDIMIANQTSRSGSVKSITTGDAKKNAYMGRLHYDQGEALHLEVSAGTNPHAGGTVASEDFDVLNIGLDSHFGDGMNVKVEYYNVSGIKGNVHDMQTLALTYTAYVTDSFEVAIKSINGSEDKDGAEADIGNHFIGFNWYPSQVTTGKSRGAKRKNNQHVVKVNYVATTGDKDGANAWQGNGKAYTDDVILAMYQFKF